jgi:8-oxo-dGTP diphosphatase
MPSTPNAASVALLDRDKILLIERAREPFLGCWTLPGGRREPGESIEECAKREVLEEIGLQLFSLRAVLIMPVGTSFQLAVFATKLFEGTIELSPEVSRAEWVRPQSIGKLRTTPDLDKVLDRVMGLFDHS